MALILKQKNWNRQIFTIGSNKTPNLFIYLLLVYGQIWLNLLMDDQQFGYIIKLGEKKPLNFFKKNKNKNSNTLLCM
jgi:hypothetical protein